MKEKQKDPVMQFVKIILMISCAPLLILIIPLLLIAYNILMIIPRALKDMKK